MPLVFVHGVNVRTNPGFNEQVAVRDSYFQRFALRTVAPDPSKVTILNPYWGDLAAKFRWNHASLPSEGVESFGGADEFEVLLLTTALGNQEPNRDTIIRDIAATSMEAAIDLLWAAAAERVQKDSGRAGSFAESAVCANDYARNNPQPTWLARTANDREFLRNLRDELDNWQIRGATALGPAAQEVEVFGLRDVWDRIREGMSRIEGVAGRATSSVLLDFARASLHRQVARFLGDALVYLEKRGTPDAPGQIPSLIMDQLEDAWDKVRPADPKIIVVAHSMGGNIMYDILSYFLPHRRPDLRVDALVTVGSQVGVFAELKLFRSIPPNMPMDPAVDRIPKPPALRYWLNVFDSNDVLAFATQGIFADSADFSYSTGEAFLGAHGSYFTLPSFHERLAERLRRLFQ